MKRWLSIALALCLALGAVNASAQGGYAGRSGRYVFGQEPSLAQMEAELIRQVNQERAKYGLGALSQSSALSQAAQTRGQEIRQSFSHTRPDGSSWRTVSTAARGENIARGQQSVDKVMAAWMTSQGHRANILRSSYRSIGVSVQREGNVLYWVQLFG